METKEIIEFKELWDKPSRKGFPTIDSIVLTIAINKNILDGVCVAGYSIKFPGYQHIPKIERAKALQSTYSTLFDVDPNYPERYILNYLELIEEKYPKYIIDRIKRIAGLDIGVRLYSKLYPKIEIHVNCIEN